MNIFALNHKFNELFFNKENLDILASFLSSFLDIPYEEINGNIVLLSDKKHYNCDESELMPLFSNKGFNINTRYKKNFLEYQGF